MRYDLHVHSCYSKCSNSQLKDILLIAKKKDLDGIALTDHNTTRGALALKRLNTDKKFEVIIGEEVESEFGHVLVYYLNSPIPKGNFAEILDHAKSQDALVALAHPFDFFRKYFPKSLIVANKRSINAIETQNSRAVNPFCNYFADRLADQLKIAKIAGSDSHFGYEIGQSFTLFDGSLRNALSRKKTTVQGRSLFGKVGLANTLLHKYF